jgi:hypothetical protein
MLNYCAQTFRKEHANSLDGSKEVGLEVKVEQIKCVFMCLQ